MNIKPIKRMARELNIDMLGNGMHCLPRDVRKYTGTICRVNRADGVVAWVVKVRHSGFSVMQHFTMRQKPLPICRKLMSKKDLILSAKDLAIWLMQRGTCHTMQ